MDPDLRAAAGGQLITAMQAGQPWNLAAQAANLPISRTAAYRRRRFEQDSPAALLDGRHNHPRLVQLGSSLTLGARGGPGDGC